MEDDGQKEEGQEWPTPPPQQASAAAQSSNAYGTFCEQGRWPVLVTAPKWGGRHRRPPVKWQHPAPHPERTLPTT